LTRGERLRPWLKKMPQKEKKINSPGSKQRRIKLKTVRVKRGNILFQEKAGVGGQGKPKKRRNAGWVKGARKETSWESIKKRKERFSGETTRGRRKRRLKKGGGLCEKIP